MDRPRHHRCNLSNANAQQLTCLLKDLQQCMQGASNFPQHINKTLTLPFQLSFIGEMQFRMAIIPILLKASLKQNRVIGEQQLNIYKQMEGQTNFQLMLEALIVLFCKQSNSRQNIVMIILAYTTSKEGAKLLISHQLDKILVSMMHSETDNSIKETSVDILCSLVSLNDARCLRMFRSSPEAAAEFIKTLKREGSVKIRRMADYLAGKFLEQLEYNGPKMAKPR